MNETQNRKLTVKTVVLVIGGAIITAVLVTLIQTLVVGKANTAVTGGIVGAVTAVLAFGSIRKK